MIFLSKTKCSKVVQSNTNIFICTHSNYFRYCHFTVIILCNITHSFAFSCIVSCIDKSHEQINLTPVICFPTV